MFKIVAFSTVVIGGAYFAGVFDHRYVRVVDRPPSAVAAALLDVDIRRAPGAPTTDPSRSGGVNPTFSHDKTDTGIVYTVHSGAQTAIRMFADIEPIDGGKRSRVTTHVQRGDAPDDFVAPAFRSTSLANGLFDMVVEAELDELTRIVGNPEKCREMIEQFQMSGPSDAKRPDNLGAAMGDTARAVMQLSAMQQEMRRAGCDTGGADGFTPARHTSQQ
ncbi:hypothetical protein EV283_3335 [Sphingomonas sp. BK036]|jgi:hypothetical protein|uniref:hypothetical protein n=1 Tax=Sphingomonas sp. BK036 TaxID=2512122 RepID=UPI001028E3BB|nr:hypothetical protein [Sphingomonas sp. BK036]RZT46389.1 hypothetical protein EV283_3335 [Sphingomonas sp. BK036]